MIKDHLKFTSLLYVTACLENCYEWINEIQVISKHIIAHQKMSHLPRTLIVSLSGKEEEASSQIYSIHISFQNTDSGFLLRRFPMRSYMCFLCVSLAVIAGGVEWGGGARRGGVSCRWGSSPPLGQLGGCSESCWEGTWCRPVDWWSCTQVWTSIQKPCTVQNPEGRSLKQKHKENSH